MRCSQPILYTGIDQVLCTGLGGLTSSPGQGREGPSGFHGSTAKWSKLSSCTLYGLVPRPTRRTPQYEAAPCMPLNTVNAVNDVQTVYSMLGCLSVFNLR